MQTAPIAICSKISESAQSLALSQSSFSILLTTPSGVVDEFTKSEREGTVAKAANGVVLFAMDSAVISFAVVVVVDSVVTSTVDDISIVIMDDVPT